MALNNGMMLGLGMGLLGVVMVVLGYRQKNRVTYGEVPLTSWHFKMFFGGAFAIIALNILFFSFKG